MSIDCSYKDIEWCNKAFHKSDECICDGNIIVPDSMDDIAKIISVRAYPSVSDSKTDSGRIQLSGQVKFSVIYTGESSPSSVYTLTALVPFTHVITAPNLTSDYISLVSVDCYSTNHTFVNSRRIKVTSSIRFCAESYKNNRMKVLTHVDGTQERQNELSISALKVVCRKNIVISASSELPAGKGAIDSIIKQNVSITDFDYKLLNNKAIVKGNISVSILYTSSGVLSDTTVTVPFTEVTEAEGLSPSLTTEIVPEISDWEIKPDTDLSGEFKMLDISVILSVMIKGFTTEKVSIVSDMFLPGGALKTSAESVRIDDISPAFHEEEFIRENITLPPELPGISKIIDLDSNLTDFSFSEKTLNLTAEITVIYLSDTETPSVCSHTAKIPISHKFSMIDPSGAKCTPKHINYTISGSDSIDIRLATDFSALCHSTETVSVFTDCEETTYTPEKRPSIVISFINSGDTLWDIAKKYNISLSNLASANALDENSPLNVGEKLIIPR